MNFGDALELLKAGHSVQRAGWNGKGMHLFLQIPSETYCDPYIVMYTAQGTYQAGWLASQADMLADDWRQVP